MHRAGLPIGAGVTLAALAAVAADVRARYRAVAEAAAAIAGPGHRSVGDGRRQSLPRYPLHLLQSERMVAARQRLLPQARRRDLPRRAAGRSAATPPSAAISRRRCWCSAPRSTSPGANGRRRIPLADLYVEDGQAHLALAADELIVAVHAAGQSTAVGLCEGARARRDRLSARRRRGGARSRDGQAVAQLRIALTGTNSRPFLLDGTDAFVGQRARRQALQAIDKLVQKQVQPMRTTLASANYRRLAAAALARRLALRLFNQSVAKP